MPLSALRVKVVTSVSATGSRQAAVADHPPVVSHRLTQSPASADQLGEALPVSGACRVPDLAGRTASGV